MPEAFSGQFDDDVDFVVCRQVLEHISAPHEFLAQLRLAIGSRHTGVYFEVPNMMCALESGVPWTIIYEHCAYYSPASFVWLFQDCGFDVQKLTEDYDGQFLGIEATPAAASNSYGPRKGLSTNSLQAIRSCVEQFVEQTDDRQQRLRDVLIDQCQRGGRVVVWGAGRTHGQFSKFARRPHDGAQHC
ncbi:MAG: methyltransferase domain-containing protein [Pirellulaceae bacterium]